MHNAAVGNAIQPATSDDDLWIALHESISLCDDPSLAVSRVAGAAASGPRTLTAVSGADATCPDPSGAVNTTTGNSCFTTPNIAGAIRPP
ncbi:hypothetical protein PHYPSEUDO_012660 [Phytophthora pseudosyringae]|uniref:Uncharacterized protein n=1 Tax=Phytophthora pseudosyringae TaxID=221518 RepID=A0A8T1V9T7_9STRA|nr:hypothetical protein PHYPSEUDO_012660 [Phytophthora pseudosyringae]